MSRRFHRLSRERQSKEIQVLTGGGVVAGGASVDEWFNVLDYGADRSGTNDSTTEIQAAIDAAEAVNGVVYFPRGTYKITKGAGTQVLTVTANVTFMGEGQELSHIDVYPKTASAAYYAIESSAAAGKTVIKGLEIIGPDTVAAFETRGISKLNDHTLRIEDVKISGVFTVCIQDTDADDLVEIIDCWLEAEQFCLNSPTSTAKTNHLYVSNTYFYQITSTNSGHHLMYLNPGLNFIFENCRFGITPSGAGYAFHIFGSDTTVPKYEIIRDCVFENGLDGTAAILSNANGETAILGCTFDNMPTNAAVIKNDCVISDCRIEGGGLRIDDGTTRITNTHFEGTGGAGLEVKGNNAIATVTGCTFVDKALLIDAAVTGRALVSGCDFVGTGAAQAIRNYDGDMEVVNSNFYGSFNTAAVYNNDTAASTGSMILKGCNFQDTSTDSVNYSGLDKSLFAEDCFFNKLVRRNGSAIQCVKQRKGIGADIASAATINTSQNFDTHHVTGTTTINTIGVGGADANYMGMFHGTRIYLIADDNWALGSSGNIVAHAITRQVNDVVELVYDADDNKWYEQHSPTSGTVFTQTASATVSNTTTETTLVSTGVGSATLPANFFKVGRTIRLKMRGYNSTAASAGTITMRAKLGSTVICATPANTATNNLSNRGWGVEVDITCRTTGASGTVFGQGKSFRSTGAGASNHWMMTATGTSTIDTTATQAVSITVQWGTANAGNTITATNFTLEVLN